MTAACLLAGLVLAGCSRQTQFTYEGSRLESMARDLQENAQADSFAKNLCVVTGEEGEEDASVTAEAAAAFGIDSKQVIFQKNPFERLYPASITKIMTALIAIRDGDLTDSVTVGPETVITETGASLAHINPGDTLTMEQLLYGLMLPSGNDAGAAIAVHMAGSTEAFAEKMNETAHALGATDTHFVNPHGLNNEDHYTTAYDLYLIFNEALKYPEFRKIIGTVGQLQFEVIQYRLLNEYNASCRWEPVSLYKACWVESDDPAELEAFKKRKYQYMAKDREGRDVFLADSGYVLHIAHMDFFHVKFHVTIYF